MKFWECQVRFARHALGVSQDTHKVNLRVRGVPSRQLCWDLSS